MANLGAKKVPGHRKGKRSEGRECWNPDSAMKTGREIGEIGTGGVTSYNYTIDWRVGAAITAEPRRSGNAPCRRPAFQCFGFRGARRAKTSSLPEGESQDEWQVRIRNDGRREFQIHLVMRQVGPHLIQSPCARGECFHLRRFASVSCALPSTI